MRGESGRQRIRVAVDADLVVERDARPRVGGDARADLQEVVVACGPQVARARLDHGQVQIVRLELAVAQAALAQEVGAAHLEPREVAAVPGDTHLVGLGVADAQARQRARGHDAAPISTRTDCSVSPPPKAAAPTTTISAPASTTLRMLDGLTPPSTCSFTRRPRARISAESRRSLSSECGSSFW